MILEICAGTIASAEAAAEGGAQRIELCSALADGGVTPSVGMMRQVREIPGLTMHVLIRPRGGDFVYDEAEVRCMADDVRAAVDCGVDGIVIGALLPDGHIDTATCIRLIQAAGNSNVNITFHRAFDLCCDPFSALEDIIAMGCNRILTSGLAESAEAGIPMLRDLNERAAGRLIILPGGGVSPANAARILNETGCKELHGSLRVSAPGPMVYRRPGVSMGTPGSDEYARKETSPVLIRELFKSVNQQN